MFSLLPNEMLEEICDYLDVSSFCVLRQTCQELYQFLDPINIIRYLRKANLILPALGQIVKDLDTIKSIFPHLREEEKELLPLFFGVVGSRDGINFCIQNQIFMSKLDEYTIDYIHDVIDGDIMFYDNYLDIQNETDAIDQRLFGLIDYLGVSNVAKLYFDIERHLYDSRSCCQILTRCSNINNMEELLFCDAKMMGEKIYLIDALIRSDYQITNAELADEIVRIFENNEQSDYAKELISELTYILVDSFPQHAYQLISLTDETILPYFDQLRMNFIFMKKQTIIHDALVSHLSSLSFDVWSSYLNILTSASWPFLKQYILDQELFFHDFQIDIPNHYTIEWLMEAERLGCHFNVICLDSNRDPVDLDKFKNASIFQKNNIDYIKRIQWFSEHGCEMEYYYYQYDLIVAMREGNIELANILITDENFLDYPAFVKTYHNNAISWYINQNKDYNVIEGHTSYVYPKVLEVVIQKIGIEKISGLFTDPRQNREYWEEDIGSAIVYLLRDNYSTSFELFKIIIRFISKRTDFKDILKNIIKSWNSESDFMGKRDRMNWLKWFNPELYSEIILHLS